MTIVREADGSVNLGREPQDQLGSCGQRAKESVGKRIFSVTL